MKQLLIINNKGGCGKTTIATNLAGFYASSGTPTALLDYDPQGSSNRWLELRPASAASIYRVFAGKQVQAGMTRTFAQRVPAETKRAIIDTPASMKRLEMMDILRKASAVVVPVLPSSIDQHVTLDFLDELMTLCRQSAFKLPIGIVANRVRSNTRAYRQLIESLEGIDIPLVASFRDSQNYVRASEEGRSIAELNTRSIEIDRQQWWSLIRWLETGQLVAKPLTIPTNKKQQELPLIEDSLLPDCVPQLS